MLIIWHYVRGPIHLWNWSGCRQCQCKVYTHAEATKTLHCYKISASLKNGDHILGYMKQVIMRFKVKTNYPIYIFIKLFISKCMHRTKHKTIGVYHMHSTGYAQLFAISHDKWACTVCCTWANGNKWYILLSYCILILNIMFVLVHDQSHLHKCQSQTLFSLNVLTHVTANMVQGKKL